MKIVIAATLAVLTVQLAWSRPQLPPLASSTTTTPAAVQEESINLESGSSCICPDGTPHCPPCAKIGIPKVFISKSYSGDHKPWYFKYQGPTGSSSRQASTLTSTNPDEIYHKQTGYITRFGPHVRGKYKVTDKCTGFSFEQLYRADDQGYHPASFTISDGSAKPPQGPNFWLDDAAPPAELPFAPDVPILPPEVVTEHYSPDLHFTTTPATN